MDTVFYLLNYTYHKIWLRNQDKMPVKFLPGFASLYMVKQGCTYSVNTRMFASKYTECGIFIRTAPATRL